MSGSMVQLEYGNGFLLYYLHKYHKRNVGLRGNRIWQRNLGLPPSCHLYLRGFMTLSYCFNIYITFMGNLCVWEREKGGGGRSLFGSEFVQLRIKWNVFQQVWSVFYTYFDASGRASSVSIDSLLDYNFDSTKIVKSMNSWIDM